MDSPRSLLFLAVIAPDVFLPQTLAEGGADLFRVVLELLRTIGRHGVLLDLDGGRQFNGEFIRHLNEEEWSRDALESKASDEEELGARSEQEIESVAQELRKNNGELDRLTERLASQRKSTAIVRKLEEDKKHLESRGKELEKKEQEARSAADLHILKAHRYRRMAAEYGTLYTQMLETLANDGRIMRVPETREKLLTSDPGEFGGKVFDALAEWKLTPDLIIVPPGYPASDKTVSLAELAQQDLLSRLSAGDSVVEKTNREYDKALGRVLQTAHHHVKLIDPYITGLAGSSNRYEPFLQLFFEMLAGRPPTLPALRVEFHVNELGNEFSARGRNRLLAIHERKEGYREGYIEDIHGKLSKVFRSKFYPLLKRYPHLTERLASIDIYYWRELYEFRRTGSGRVVDSDAIGERFHDRYFIADHAGVELPYGLDCLDPEEEKGKKGNGRQPNYTVLKLLSRSAKEFVEDRFRWAPENLENLPYESVSGPMRIDLKGKS